MKRFVPFLLLLGVAAAFFLYQWYVSLSPEPLYNLNKAPKAAQPLRFKVVNHLADTLTQQNLQGKITIVNFFYVRCPSVCPRMQSHVRRVYHRFQGDNRVQFWSFTVNPEEDSVSVLRRYAHDLLGTTQRQWHFITGDKKTIYTLAINYFNLHVGQPDTSLPEFFHSDEVVLVDSDLNVIGYFKGSEEEEMERLQKQIIRLLRGRFE